MKYFILILTALISLVVGAQDTTFITKTFDTVTVKKQQRTKTIKVGALVYKDSTLRYDTIVTTIKKFTNVPPITTTPPPPTTGEKVVNLSISQLTDDGYIRPGAGPEQWHNGSAGINYPTETDNRPPLDVYYRFLWTEIENVTQGSYNWTYFDGLVKGAIDRGQKLSFGVMSLNTDVGASVGGARLSYPAYLHTLMQKETYKDWIAAGAWIPNWNSQYYLSRLEALYIAIKGRLMTQFHKGVLFADAIYCIDIRGFGNWGEWHTDYANFDAHPTGRKPTQATLKAIIDIHTRVFDRWPLVNMIAAYDGGATYFPLFHPYPDVAYYALTAKNAWGQVGFRRDQWGATDEYLRTMLKNNWVVYNGVPLKNLIMNIWKTAPITGEPMPSSFDMTDLMNQVLDYHPTSIGNGNYGATPTAVIKDRIRAAFKKCGYRLTVANGKVTTNAGTIKIELNWQNVGYAPSYENWDVVFEVVSSTGVVTTLGTSVFKPKLFLPQSTYSLFSDVFNTSLIGTFTLRVKVKDPANYRQPLPLQIDGRQADGSYNLGTITL